MWGRRKEKKKRKELMWVRREVVGSTSVLCEECVEGAEARRLSRVVVSGVQLTGEACECHTT